MTYTFKLARRNAQNHPARVAPALLLALFAAACGAAGPTDATPAPVAPVAPAPVPGWLTVQLDTPNTNDGAVQVVITGPALEAAEVATGYDGITTVEQGTAYLVVTGAVTDGAVARIRVPDVGRAAVYTATVQAAAARGTYALQPTAAYRVTLAR